MLAWRQKTFWVNYSLERFRCNYSGGGGLFDPLLILDVCPLTKKLSVYNFNGLFEQWETE